MASEMLKALSDPTRMKILRSLGDTEICACEFAALTGRAQPTVSRHLSLLEAAGALKSRRDGKRILYSITDPRILKILDLAEEIKVNRG